MKALLPLLCSSAALGGEIQATNTSKCASCAFDAPSPLQCAQRSQNGAPRLRIANLPEVQTPHKPNTFLLSDDDIPVVAEEVRQDIEELRSHGPSHALTRRLQTNLTRWHHWLRGPVQELPIQRQMLHLVDRHIAWVDEITSMQKRMTRFKTLYPLIASLQFTLREDQVFPGLRLRIQSMLDDRIRTKVSLEFTTVAGRLLTLSEDEKWQLFERMEAQLLEADPRDPSFISQLTLLYGLYLDHDLMRRFFHEPQKYIVMIDRMQRLDVWTGLAVITGSKDVAFYPEELQRRSKAYFSGVPGRLFQGQYRFYTAQIEKLKSNFEKVHAYSRIRNFVNSIARGMSPEFLAGVQSSYADLLKVSLPGYIATWQQHDLIEEPVAGTAIFAASRVLAFESDADERIALYTSLSVNPDDLVSLNP